MDLIDTAELAKRLGRTAWTIRQWVRTGYLTVRPIKMKGRDMWRVSDLDRWVTELSRQQHPTREPRGRVKQLVEEKKRPKRRAPIRPRS